MAQCLEVKEFMVFLLGLVFRIGGNLFFSSSNILDICMI